MKQAYLIFFACILALAGCTQDRPQLPFSRVENLGDFEKSVYSIRSTLLHEHTYDKANIQIADSLYEESERVGSDYGKLVSLQIKYYALITDQNASEEFIKTVDRFIRMAKTLNEKEFYYDGLNAKVYHLIEKKMYLSAQDIIKDVLKEAEKSGDREGLYFSNYMLGNIYQHSSNPSIAEPYMQKALQYVEDDSIKQSLMYRELSILSSRNDNLRAALEYARKSLEVASTDVHKLWSEHQYLISLYINGEKQLFEEEYGKSILITEKSDGILPTYMQQQLSVRHCIIHQEWNEALKIAGEIEYDNIRLQEQLSIYRESGDFRNAFLTQEKIIAQQDSAQHALQLEALSEMEAKLGNSQLKLQSEELRARNMRTIYISVISILFIIGAVFVYINFKSRKHNQELSRKNQELDIARQKAEHASQVKSVFLRNMTHEFNTPLNQICGFSQLLSDKDFPLDEENVREMSSAILESGTHLTHVLQNIVEVTERLSNMTKLEDVESILKTVEHPEEETK